MSFSLNLFCFVLFLFVNERRSPDPDMDVGSRRPHGQFLQFELNVM